MSIEMEGGRIPAGSGHHDAFRQPIDTPIPNPVANHRIDDGDHVAASAKALRRVLRKQQRHERLQSRKLHRQRFRRLHQHGTYAANDAVRCDRQAASDHPVKHHAKRVDVCALVDGVALGLLRAEATGGAKNRARTAVDYVAAVRFTQGFSDLFGQRQGLAHRKRPAFLQQLLQAAIREVRHGEEGPPVLCEPELVHRHDVRMVPAPRRRRFRDDGDA